MRDHLVAVDVGTASARAGLFDRSGAQLSRATFPITLYQPEARFAEYDSEEIWSAVCRSVKAVLAQAEMPANRIAAIAFDATCSLVVRGGRGEQVSVSNSGHARFDTIAWMDHRALREAESLSRSGHPLLCHSGGTLSPEMAIPKLSWLKARLPDSWKKAASIFDLADYLTFRASGSTARSTSTLAAKWCYQAQEEEGWSPDFLALAGLDDLLEKAALPARATLPGTAIGTLLARAADDLGLDGGCKVSPGMIDAYAGAAGLLAPLADKPEDIRKEAALVAGTSSCIIRITHQPEAMTGFWGPYFSTGLPGLWLTEGGQSAAGSALDHVVRMHAAGGVPDASLHARIIERITALIAIEGDQFGRPIDVLPDFLGNRSPLADPRATATYAGLSLDASFDGLCRLYWRTAVGIACGIRHILDAMAERGAQIDRLHMAGGHARNALLVSLYANVTGRSILVAEKADAVLLGSAMNAAAAAGLEKDMIAAGHAMSRGRLCHDPDPARKAACDQDYRRYQALIRHRQELAELG